MIGLTALPRLSLRLRPLQDGTSTDVILSGVIYTAPPATELRRLFRLLAAWQGGFVDVALCVDGTNAGATWAEFWEGRLARVPGRHQPVQFLIRRDTLGPEDDDA